MGEVVLEGASLTFPQDLSGLENIGTDYGMIMAIWAAMMPAVG